jgi:hypothetical protein
MRRLICKTYPVSLGHSRGLLRAWRAVLGGYSELYETIALLVCRQLAHAIDAGFVRLVIHCDALLVLIDLQHELLALERLDSAGSASSLIPLILAFSAA